MTIRYENTAHGVMVQVHTGPPMDAEWAAMLDFMVRHKATIKAVLTISQGDSGPTSKQRADLAESLKHMARRLPFALLTDSRVARGVLTAINWLTKRADESRVFPVDGMESALAFFLLDEPEKAAVRALVSKLGGLAPAPRVARR
jgi:hypothetical protein